MRTTKIKNFIEKNKFRIIVILIIVLIIILFILLVVFSHKELNSTFDNNEVNRNIIFDNTLDNNIFNQVDNNTINNTTTDTTVAEQQPETPIQPTDNNQGSTSNGSTSKPSSGSSSTSKPSGSSESSSSGSSSSSNKPSGGSSSSSGGSSSSVGSSSSGGSSSNTPAHTPFSTYSKYNASKTAQAVAWVKDEINKVGDSQYATVVASSSRPSGRTYSTFNETNARRKVSGGAVGTVYVYVEDTYMYDSSGTTANIFDTPMYIWIVN